MLILKVAVPCPLHTLLDYRPPPNADTTQLQPGIRVKVPFGQRKQASIGIVVELADNTDLDPDKLKTVVEIIDANPLLPKDLLALCQWVSQYYHYPIGEVFAVALPALLRQGKPAYLTALTYWQATEAGLAIETNNHRLSEPQRRILQRLQAYPQGLSVTALNSQSKNPHPTLKSLQKKGWLRPLQLTANTEFAKPLRNAALPLNPAQQAAYAAITAHLNQFNTFLLDGVTGSGKTEIYLQVIQAVLQQHKQALVLVPEINLTPQMLARFQARFAVPVEVFHSQFAATDQAAATPLIIGTRSAVWMPLARPGVLIVDEEHDGSYKQQEGLRYSARDVAIMRARQLNIPIILGSATPSLESLANAQQGRYQSLRLPERAGAAVHPRFQVVDMRQQSQRSPLSIPLKKAIQQRLAQQEQVLIFINRRGYAPLLMCYQCGWVATCQHCDANVTYHQESTQLHCHHCGAINPVPTRCPRCHNPKIALVGQGTERLEAVLQKAFPSARLLRMDSDNVRNRVDMEAKLQQIHTGAADILIGTQMLAKGHHFARVTLVGIINVDGGLFSHDFRGTEKMGQLLLQVAGRAGRVDAPGDVIMQTYHPAHPLLKPLLQQNYPAFTQLLLAERHTAQFPPYTYLALLRCEAIKREDSEAFLKLAKAALLDLNYQDVHIWGPAPAPMERRADWYRAQLLLQASQRRALHTALDAWLPLLHKLPALHRVRWSLDIDPVDLY